ncbi:MULTISPECIES: MarR family transcriptional regulator [unclassified Desulfovibrio]|uniref:MarR family winged helix-turn-helix transcriptional regulator n=1 Tax=unclassified Desulfovibrio TaxID=2593640 RepID=UPI0013EE2E6E|nr:MULTISPECIES: MarR family transcriptional regulator [unclassified Desulfovibrio]
MSEADDEKNALGYHLHRAFAALTETLHAELRAAGLSLTHPQFSVLQAVSRKPGISQNGLARETGKDGAAISRSLDYLEKRGLVRRAPLNGCTKGVFLTQKAEDLRPLLDGAIRKTVARACRDMTPEEVETVIRLLEKISSTLHEGAKDN